MKTCNRSTLNYNECNVYLKNKTFQSEDGMFNFS